MNDERYDLIEIFNFFSKNVFLNAIGDFSYNGYFILTRNFSFNQWKVSKKDPK